MASMRDIELHLAANKHFAVHTVTQRTRNHLRIIPPAKVMVVITSVEKSKHRGHPGTVRFKTVAGSTKETKWFKEDGRRGRCRPQDLELVK